MPEFLEERLPIAIRAGAGYADDYNVEITQTAAGAESRRLIHAWPRRTFNIHYTQQSAELWDQILALYHRAYGMFAGFRVKALDDYTTNARTAAPTNQDQVLPLLSAGVYQLQISYGAGGTPLGIGRPVRTIFKPVTNTTLIAIGTVSAPVTTMWSVNTATGRVTFAADKSRAISAITQAASAVVTVGAHTFLVGESVHFSSVQGMTQINGLRGTISATGGTTITVDINSTAFSAYTKGGVTHTNPQSGAQKTGNITAITQAASAVVTVGAHSFLVGEAVLFAAVGGMTQINGLTGVITAIGGTTITVDINSTAFSAYTSGGTAKTALLTAEVVKGGCEFDIPCRFNSRVDITALTPGMRESGPIELIELLNP